MNVWEADKALAQNYQIALVAYELFGGCRCEQLRNMVH